jgi:predicted lipoprotein
MFPGRAVERIQRRNLLMALGAGTLAGASLVWVGQRQSPRERVLEQTLRRVAIPDARLIAQTTQLLNASVERLLQVGTLEQLTRTQRAWRAATLAWQRGVAFQQGPFVDTGALLRAAFWPVRREAIDDLLSASERVDTTLVASLGVDSKGLFALEQLLFDERSVAGQPWLLSQPRALALTQALTHDVSAYADRASAALGDGELFVREFAHAGQQSLNRLVTQLLRRLETATLRIDSVLGMLANHSLSLDVVQGGRSGLSTDILSTWLELVRRVYGADLEASLATLVRSVAPAVDRRMQQLLNAAVGSLQSLGKPLEEVLRIDPTPLRTAWTQLKALEVGVRADLASALGVTITFNSSDGD